MIEKKNILKQKWNKKYFESFLEPKPPPVAYSSQATKVMHPRRKLKKISRKVAKTGVFQPFLAFQLVEQEAKGLPAFPKVCSIHLTPVSSDFSTPWDLLEVIFLEEGQKHLIFASEEAGFRRGLGRKSGTWQRMMVPTLFRCSLRIRRLGGGNKIWETSWDLQVIQLKVPEIFVSAWYSPSFLTFREEST